MTQTLTSWWLRWRHRSYGRRPRRAAVFAWLPTGEVRDASATPGEGFFALPSVHPRGVDVVYHGGSSERSRIWRTDLGSGEARPLTPDSLVACSPSYSRDGSRIVFSAYEVGKHPSCTMAEAVRTLPGVGLYFGGVPYWMRLFVMNADGSGLRALTAGPSSDTRPSFTSDGAEVLFLRRVGLPWRPRGLWRVRVDAGEPEALLRDVSVGRPSSAIDGSSVYVFTRVAGRDRLAVVPGAGGDLGLLPNDTLGAWSRGPFCDPDGRRLWYHCGVEGGSLCRLDLEGGPPVVMRPPGFEKRSCAHASVSATGVVAFDWVEEIATR